MQNDFELEERDYFKEPFTEDELKELAGDTPLSEMFARRSPALKNMGLAGQELSDDEILALMLKEPRLVRRPLVRMEGKLLVGATVKAVEAALAG